MVHLVTLSGSPSTSSKTLMVVDYIREMARHQGWKTDLIQVRNFPSEDLLYARFDSPSIQEAVSLLKQADGVLIATPVYKASYTGVLKAFLDLMPQDVLSGKVAWPIAVGGTLAHLLVLEYALKPVLSALGAQNIQQGIYIQDSQIHSRHQGEVVLEGKIEERIAEGFRQFGVALGQSSLVVKQND